MRAVFLVALWVAISMPVALVIAAGVRVARGAGIADEVELYLKALRAHDRARRRSVTIAVLCVSVTGIGLALAAPLAGVTERVYTVANGTRDLFGPDPEPRTAKPSTPATTTTTAAPVPAAPAAGDGGRADVVADDPSGGTVEQRGPIVAPGILGGPSDSSRWRRGEQRGTSGAAATEDAEDDETGTADDGEKDDTDAAATDEDEVDEAPADDANTEDTDEPLDDGNHNDDLDGDGITNDEDDDLDGDGITNDDDDDLDGDGITNNEDDDLDGDGIPNDDDAAADEPAPRDSDGSADSQESRQEETSS